jgi:TATA-box binding protein (TBP) (component of TFIID and TFIIIB)
MVHVCRGFDDMLRGVAAVNAALRSLRPSLCSISMMTITGVLSCASVALSAVFERLLETDGRWESISLAPVAMARGGRGRNFSNQLALVHGRMAIKLFKNGSIHVTGCRSVVAFAAAADDLCTMLRVFSDTPHRLNTAEIHMINATYSVDRSLPLATLRSACLDAGIGSASYEPDIYAALRVKIPLPASEHKATAIAFKTGCIMLSGARKPSDITHVYGVFCRVIDGLSPVPSTPRLRPVNLHHLDTWSISGGYSSRITHLCAGAD